MIQLYRSYADLLFQLLYVNVTPKYIYVRLWLLL